MYPGQCLDGGIAAHLRASAIWPVVLMGMALVTAVGYQWAVADGGSRDGRPDRAHLEIMRHGVMHALPLCLVVVYTYQPSVGLKMLRVLECSSYSVGAARGGTRHARHVEWAQGVWCGAGGDVPRTRGMPASIFSCERFSLRSPLFASQTNDLEAAWLYSHGSNVSLLEAFASQPVYESYRAMHSIDSLGYGLFCSGDEYRRVRVEALVYAVLWLLGSTVLYMALLRAVKPAVQRRRPTPLSRATSFLHSEVPQSTCQPEPRLTTIIPHRCTPAPLLSPNSARTEPAPHTPACRSTMSSGRAASRLSSKCARRCYCRA
jgi:hypothetical protein